MGSRKRWLKTFINNIIYIIVSRKFCIVIIPVHYTLFIDIFRRNKVNCYCKLNVPSTRCLKIFENFWKVFFYWQVFISIIVTFIFNIITVPKLTYSFWFVIIIFLFKNGSNISNYYVFNCLIFFSFSLKRLIMILIMLSSDCFCIFNLLSLFPLRYKKAQRLKKLTLLLYFLKFFTPKAFYYDPPN